MKREFDEKIRQVKAICFVSLYPNGLGLKKEKQIEGKIYIIFDAY
jgi:hypothetical protein